MANTQKIIPLEAAPSLTSYHTFDADIASYLYIASAVDLYSGGPRFQSRPGHRLSWSSSWLLNFQLKNRERTSIRTRPFPCVYCQAIVQRYTLRDTDGIAWYLRARISICCWGKLMGDQEVRWHYSYKNHGRREHSTGGASFLRGRIEEGYYYNAPCDDTLWGHEVLLTPSDYSNAELHISDLCVVSPKY